ncbi:hypothetical protein [Saccharopolyspora tripterygii]
MFNPEAPITERGHRSESDLDGHLGFVERLRQQFLAVRALGRITVVALSWTSSPMVDG